MRKLFLVLFISVWTGSAFAFDCFSKYNIRDFKATKRNQIQVRVGRHKYQVTTGSCFGLRFAESIGFDTRPRNSSRVCENDFLLVIDGFGRLEDRCIITDITAL